MLRAQPDPNLTPIIIGTADSGGGYDEAEVRPSGKTSELEVSGYIGGLNFRELGLGALEHATVRGIKIAKEKDLCSVSPFILL